MKNSSKIHKKTPFYYTYQLIVASLLFSVTAYISFQGILTKVDLDLFQLVYQMPALFLPFFLIVTQFGSIYMLLVLLLLFAIKQKFAMVARLLLTGTLAFQLSGFAKSLWGKERPFELLNNVINRDIYIQGPAFPSGHTALATALALTVHGYLPARLRWLTPTWIVLVGMSRLYLGVHTPLDLIGGFAIGWFCFALYQHVQITIPLLRQKRRKQAAR